MSNRKANALLLLALGFGVVAVGQRVIRTQASVLGLKSAEVALLGLGAGYLAKQVLTS